MILLAIWVAISLAMCLATCVAICLATSLAKMSVYQPGYPAGCLPDYRHTAVNIAGMELIQAGRVNWHSIRAQWWILSNFLWNNPVSSPPPLSESSIEWTRILKRTTEICPPLLSHCLQCSRRLLRINSLFFQRNFHPENCKYAAALQKPEPLF